MLTSKTCLAMTSVLMGWRAAGLEVSREAVVELSSWLFSVRLAMNLSIE